MGFPGDSDVKEPTWVRSLGWDYPLEKGTTTYCGILSGLEKSTDRGAWQATVKGLTKSWT